MMRSMVLALVGLATATPVASTSPAVETSGEVTAVSVLPGSGQAHVIIDVRGGVSVQDFMLENPARLVIDVTGATLRVPRATYDGANRGGILNVRYSQYRSDVVRVVLELDRLRDYELEYADDAVRITMGTDRSFTAWSSTARSTSLAATDLDFAQATPVRLPNPEQPDAPPQQSQQPFVTATYQEASIADVVAGFAEMSGKTIIIGKDVEGTVTAEVKNQPWDVALQAILESQGLAAREDPPGIIRVDSRAVLAARDSTEPLETKIVAVNYARAASLVPVISSVLSTRGKVVADTGTNSLIITDITSRIADDSSFVAELDVPTPQVSIQAKIIFVNRTDIEELGVRYDLGSPDQFYNTLVQRPDPTSASPVDTDGDGVPDAFVATDFFDPETNVVDLGGNSLSAVGNANAVLLNPALELIYSTAIGNFDLTTFVEALQRVELADLQAEPLTTTSDNTEAYILVGERTPVRQVDVGSDQQQGAPRAVTEFVPTGIQLRVTPHVTNNRQVLLSVHAENSSIQSAPADVGFTFQTQEASSQVLVDDGQTAVIGGLTVTEVSVQKSGIPYLVDLPLIGGLFGFTSRRETRRDLLILVTPHIIDNPTSSALGN